VQNKSCTLLPATQAARILSCVQPTEQNRLFGQRVAALRGQSGLNQADLAARLGDALGKKMDPTTVTRMERGTRPTSVTEIYALVEALGVGIRELLPSEQPVQHAVLQLGGRLRSLDNELSEARSAVGSLERLHHEVAEAKVAAERLSEAKSAASRLDNQVFADLEVLAGLGYRTVSIHFPDVFSEFLPYAGMYGQAERWAIEQIHRYIDRGEIDDDGTIHEADIHQGLVNYLRFGPVADDRAQYEEYMGEMMRK